MVVTILLSSARSHVGAIRVVTILACLLASLLAAVEGRRALRHHCRTHRSSSAITGC